MLKFLPLVWRNLGRNKLRNLLTGAAIAMSITLMCLLRTLPAGLDYMLEQMTRNTRISIHNKAGLVYPLPYSYLDKVRATPGIVEAMSWTWFGGALDEDEGVTFPSFAVDPEPLLRVYPDQDIAPSALADFERYRDAALVGRQTLAKQGWKTGDLVTLKSTVLPVTLTFRIVGAMGNERIPFFLFQREYLEQTANAAGMPFDELSLIWARVESPEAVNPVMSAIDQLFRNSEAETVSETEKSYYGSFFGSLKGFVTVILIVTGLVTVCVVFIAANTASMSVRERVGEIAVMKTLGFGWRVLFGILILEGVLLSSAAGAAGILVVLVLSRILEGLVAWNPQLGPLGAFIVTDAIMVEGLFLAFFIGILSGVVPCWGAARRGVAETLREVF